MVTLSECGKIVTGGTPPKKHSEYYSSRDIHFYKPNDFTDDGVSILEASEEFISEAARNVADIFPTGTVLVTCIGNIGKIGILSDASTCNQQINVIIPFADKCLSEYIAIAIWVRKSDLIKLANATTVPIINKTLFSSFKIPLPTIEQQRSFVEFFKQSDKSKFELQKALDELTAMQKKLMLNIFSEQ